MCDVRVPGDDHVQLLLRLYICHILQVCSHHTADLDAGVPARGLNGEAYRGHVFWDELFVYPFLNFRMPEVTRGLLMYRYRRLGEARAAAREAGIRGAMFPWQSGSEGKEETQRVHLNPLSGRWEPDLSHNQRHVNVAIFYNIWHYFQTTDDLAFLRDYGAEMMLEITRFWASIAHFNPERERYEIHGVMGPDEFHEKYPDAAEGGLRNNAYTNVMVAWLCAIGHEVLSLLPATRADALRGKLGLGDEELRTWADMSRRMFVPFHGDGIISQFEGYEDLAELDWDAYRAKYGNVQRLDRILRAEGDAPDHYKLAKQADTVMLFFLFSREDLRRLFERLGYDYGPDTARKNIAYYDERTSHGSTLSFVAHSSVLARLDIESSWERFLVALESDVGDVQGGTTKEGIHMGVISGTLDLIQRSYAGHADPRRSPVLRPPAAPAARRAVVRDAVPGDPATRDARRGETDASRPPGWGAAADQRRGRRRGPRVVRRGAVHVRAPAEPTCRDPAGPRLTGGRMPAFQGAIFDVDGVLVDSPHQKAWQESLRELMEGEWSDIRDQTTWSPGAFTPQVYQEEMSGKPRLSGARAALEYFHVPDQADLRLDEYAQRKQKMVVRLIEAGDFTAFPDALRFIIAVKDVGIRVAAASSSKNAKLFLGKIRLDTFAREQGITSASLRPGLHAAGLLRRRRLGPGVRPRKARP